MCVRKCGFWVGKGELTAPASTGDGPNNPTHAAVFYRLFSRQMPSKPALLYEKKGLLRPLHARQHYRSSLVSPLLPLKYSQTLPATARIRSESRESFARKPGIQACSSALEASRERRLCAAAPASAAAHRSYEHLSATCHRTSPSRVPQSFSCPCLPCLSAVMAMRLHCDQARLPWRAFPLRREEVCAPSGGSNPCGRILNDRAALSREFPRN